MLKVYNWDFKATIIKNTSINNDEHTSNKWTHKKYLQQEDIIEDLNNNQMETLEPENTTGE